MADSEKGKARRSQQVIKAVKGSTIRNVTQAVVSGDITGDVHIGDKIYLRSEWEELNDYVTKAVFAYESQTYQVLRRQASSVHPYKFLHSFTIEDASIFFGRKAATEELYKKVIHDRLTVVHARSGAGKTSLLNAGLSPRLIQEARLPVCVHIRPFEEDPVRDLKRALVPPSLGPWPKLLSTLSMHEFLGLVCTHLSRDTKELVIIFDQFEQFLISLPEAQVRLPFIKILSDCYEDQTLPVRFVFALRHENLGDLDEFESFIPEILQNRYRLLPMNLQEVKEAITGPIGLQKETSIEPALLDTLLQALGGKEVELTHLQIVCTKLYDALPNAENVISVRLYNSLGEVEGILSSYLGDTLSTLPDYKRLVARNVLKALVSSEATNRILRLPDLVAVTPPDVSVVEDVLQYLVDTRLLRQDDTLEGKEYELAHAYLAEEVFHWVGKDEIVNKRAQELLQRELANWRIHRTLIDEDKLNILRDHFEFLTLDREAQNLLFLSALEQGHDIVFWMKPLEDKQDALQQVAAHLETADERVRKKIADDVHSKLDASLRPYLLSLLWNTFDKTRGQARQKFANTLWTFRPWLTSREKARVFPSFALVWTRENTRLIVASLSALVLVGVLTGLFLSVERPVPGRWISIPAGSFIMGMDEEEAELAASLCQDGALEDFKAACLTSAEFLESSGRQVDAELPQFSILENEVTNAQYQQCVDAGICQPPGAWGYEKEMLNHPATLLNWYQAEQYCEWLGGRLPTESEWEKAARGPDNTIYPWGDAWDASKANLEQSGIETTPRAVDAMMTDISGYQVINMAGNVREWTASVAFPLRLNDPFKAEVYIPEYTGEDMPVIVRGGSWVNERSSGMASNRGIDSVMQRRDVTGFRCACPEGTTCNSPWDWQWIWFGQ